MATAAGDGNFASQTVAETINKFNNDFLKIVANDNHGNLITSPLSVQVVLAMAAYGAGGMTASQMRSVLSIPADNDFGQSGYQSIIKSFNSVTGAELRLANKIYTASHFEVKSAFKALTTQKFLSTSQQLDFNNTATAATTINTWCEEQTNKRIQDVITPDDLSPDMKLVLVNAVYFKGQWKHKFDPLLTKNKLFYIDDNTTKRVPTMFIIETFFYGDLPQLKAKFIEIPYKGNQLSMIIILPNEVNGLIRVLDNLHRVNLRRCLLQAHPREIELFLPKFKIESTLHLRNTLEKLGMTDMFTDQADFSGIGDTQLKISKVIQKAFIEVNEEGGEVAAFTSCSVELCAVLDCKPTTLIKVDRPYHYTIYHRSTGISLLTGIVEQPNLP